MTDAASVVAKLAEEGNSAQAIAEELNLRGMRGRGGRAYGASDVAGFLRFIDVAGMPQPLIPKIERAAWGKVRRQSRPVVGEELGTDSGKPRKNRPAFHFGMSAEARADVSRLYQHERMSPSAIADKLALPLRRVQPYCAHLAGFDVPPGEITEIIDSQGRKVSICPPAFARGIYPQRNVRTKGAY